MTYNRDRQENQRRIILILTRIKKFLNDNRLTVNEGKMIIIEQMMKKKRARLQGDASSITVMDQDNNPNTIKAGKETLLLGATLQDNTTWQCHLDIGSNALIPKIRIKLGIIKHVARDFSTEAKLLLINGYIMSQILYLKISW